MRTLAAAALLGFVSACAPPAPDPAPAAASAHKIIVRIRSNTSNIGGSTEQPNDRDLAGFIWIENRSTDTVSIVSITLHDCLNIKEACEKAIPVKVRLVPRQRERIFTVHRQVPGAPVHMTYTYDWSSGGPLRTGTSSLETQLHPSDIEKLGDQIVFLHADPDSVVLPVGGVLVASQLHIVALGAKRDLLGQFRGNFEFRLQEGTVDLIPPDTLIGKAPGRRVLTVTPDNTMIIRKTPLPALKISLIVK